MRPMSSVSLMCRFSRTAAWCVRVARHVGGYSNCILELCAATTHPLSTIGPDIGFDSIGDWNNAIPARKKVWSPRVPKNLGSLLFLYICGFQLILGWGAVFDHIEILTILRVGEVAWLTECEHAATHKWGGHHMDEV